MIMMMAMMMTTMVRNIERLEVTKLKQEKSSEGANHKNWPKTTAIN